MALQGNLKNPMTDYIPNDFSVEEAGVWLQLLYPIKFNFEKHD